MGLKPKSFKVESIINADFKFVGSFALKSANNVRYKDVVGTFFIILINIRGPPTINLIFKKLN